MFNFKQYLNERYINAVDSKENSEALKNRYVDQVWDLLQKSYASIGGIKGSGFGSKEDMIKNIPFWKMAVKDGTVKVVVMYKDAGGRKSVAMGSDGSDWARKRIKEIFAIDFKRAFGEKSKGALGALLKSTPWDVLEPFIVRPDKVKAIQKGVVPIKDVPKDQWPDDAKITLSKNPKLVEYGYLRPLGPKKEMTFKVMIGTTGKHI